MYNTDKYWMQEQKAYEKGFIREQKAYEREQNAIYKQEQKEYAQLEREYLKEEKAYLKQEQAYLEQQELIRQQLEQLQNIRTYPIPPQIFSYIEIMLSNGLKINRQNIIDIYEVIGNETGINSLDNDIIKLIIYTYKLSNGTKQVNNERDLKELLKTVSLNRFKITVNDLKIQRFRVYQAYDVWLKSIGQGKTDNKQEDKQYRGSEVYRPKRTKELQGIKNNEPSQKELPKYIGDYLEWELPSLQEMFNCTSDCFIIERIANDITEVPRYAIVKNISEAPFNIYNTKQSKEIYEVVSLSNTTGKVTLKTKLKPTIRYKGSRETRGLKVDIPTQTEIDLGHYTNKEVKVQVERGYYKLCNKYAIVGTLRPPHDDVNLGYYRLMSKDGTVVYVVARLIDFSKALSGSNLKEQRIYHVGFNPLEVEQKLYENMLNLQTKLGAYLLEKVEPTTTFTLTSRVITQDDDLDDDGESLID